MQQTLLTSLFLQLWLPEMSFLNCFQFRSDFLGEDFPQPSNAAPMLIPSVKTVTSRVPKTISSGRTDCIFFISRPQNQPRTQYMNERMNECTMTLTTVTRENLEGIEGDITGPEVCVPRGQQCCRDKYSF